MKAQNVEPLTERLQEVRRTQPQKIRHSPANSSATGACACCFDAKAAAGGAFRSAFSRSAADLAAWIPTNQKLEVFFACVTRRSESPGPLYSCRSALIGSTR